VTTTQGRGWYAAAGHAGVWQSDDGRTWRPTIGLPAEPAVFVSSVALLDEMIVAAGHTFDETPEDAHPAVWYGPIDGPLTATSSARAPSWGYATYTSLIVGSSGVIAVGGTQTFDADGSETSPEVLVDVLDVATGRLTPLDPMTLRSTEAPPSILGTARGPDRALLFGGIERSPQDAYFDGAMWELCIDVGS
jgi:hypothetical protein